MKFCQRGSLKVYLLYNAFFTITVTIFNVFDLLFLEVLKIESIEILEVSSKTAKFRLSLAPGSPKFSGIEISLSGDGLDVKREMRLGLKIFDLDLLQPQTSYTMRVTLLKTISKTQSKLMFINQGSCHRWRQRTPDDFRLV